MLLHRIVLLKSILIIHQNALKTSGQSVNHIMDKSEDNEWIWIFALNQSKVLSIVCKDRRMSKWRSNKGGVQLRGSLGAIFFNPSFIKAVY